MWRTQLWDAACSLIHPPHGAQASDGQPGRLRSLLPDTAERAAHTWPAFWEARWQDMRAGKGG